MTSSFAGLLPIMALVALAVAAIFMPLFVIRMSSQVDKMRKLLEKLLWQAEQQARREMERDERRAYDAPGRERLR